MNKDLVAMLKRMKEQSEMRLKSLQTRAEDPKLTEDDAKALQDAADKETAAHKDVVDQLANLTSTENNPASDDNNGSESESEEKPGDDDNEHGAVVSPQVRDGIKDAIRSGMQGQGQLSKVAKNEQIRSAFAKTVIGAMPVEEARSLGIVTGNGSVTVPEVVASEIISYAQEENLLRKYGSVVRTSGDVKYPVLVKKATATGHKLERADDKPMSETAIEFDEVLLSPTEFDALATVTKKLLAMTGLPVENIVIEELTKAYVRQEANYMFNGDETDNINDGALAKKAVAFTPTAAVDLTAADAGQKIYDALIEMKNTPVTEVMNKGRFIMNRAALTMVEKMKTADGFPLLRPLNQAEGGIGNLLVGYPTDVTDYADKKGSANTPVIYFGDFSKFHIQDVVGAMEVQKLVEKFADTNRIGFKIYNLLDGQLIYSPFEPAAYKWEVATAAKG
ncbi:major capsid protein [Levilactobacillus senmaizukei DSM 21775 = NBRC 103853]|uniref:Major capsid protein n=1 Tax=Levilactobacillus senmaizukei DSM 21775 = NBRC 103853 TaxID=1423803 RepID=A0A0R2DMH2_9LACO|nr:phage major capsid protein [Levilactobacillus senmaizukei]KRN01452.1 major capsid protein [Levilactobacillus senmaizukei DSM 21775 = NBRC 103853]